MADDAQHDGEHIDRQKRLVAKAVAARKQDVKGRGAGAHITRANQDLTHREAEPWKLQPPALDFHDAARRGNPYQITGYDGEGRPAVHAADASVRMGEFGYGRGAGQEAPG